MRPRVLYFTVVVAVYQIIHILFWLFALSANSAFAAKIYQQQVEIPGEDNPLAIIIDGPINRGDEVVFRKLLNGKAKKATQVHLRSGGGLVTESLEIGRLIRSKGMTTVADNYCVSACGLIWLGGENLLVTKGAYLGFHAAYDKTGKVAAVANALIGGFINELGYEQAVIRYATMAQPAGMNFLTMNEAVIMGLKIRFAQYTVLPEIEWKNGSELEELQVLFETPEQDITPETDAMPKQEEVPKEVVRKEPAKKEIPSTDVQKKASPENVQVTSIYKLPQVTEVRRTGRESWYRFHKEEEPARIDFEKAFKKQQEDERRRREIEKPIFIKAVQEELNRLNCHAGEIDGMWGTNTQRAVQEFARLTETKYDGFNDLDKLLLEMKERTEPVCSLDCVKGYAKVSDVCKPYPLTKLKRYLRKKKAEKAKKQKDTNG